MSFSNINVNYNVLTIDPKIKFQTLKRFNKLVFYTVSPFGYRAFVYSITPIKGVYHINLQESFSNWSTYTNLDYNGFTKFRYMHRNTLFEKFKDAVFFTNISKNKNYLTNGELPRKNEPRDAFLIRTVVDFLKNQHFSDEFYLKTYLEKYNKIYFKNDQNNN